MHPADAIPLIDLATSSERERAEIEAALRRVIASGQFVLGPEVEAFEEEFAEYCGRRFAVGCASGSDALLLALMALRLEPGDEVVCPAFTFFATASAITRLGGSPVFADIDRRSFNLDPELAAAAARRSSRLRAILPVDLFGQVADLEPLLALGRELGVPIVSDAAQTVGARDAAGRRAGSQGEIACFSFYPTKNLGAYGDAGILLTDDPAHAERLRLLRAHGAREDYIHQEVGINSRLDALQAAVLRVRLHHLGEGNEARRSHAAHYQKCFTEAGAVCGTAGVENARLPLLTPGLWPPGGTHVFHQFAIRVPAALRDGLRSELGRQRIGTRVYYPIGLHQQQCFAPFAAAQTRERELPETESAARETLCLPMYPGLRHSQIERVVEAVAGYLERRPPARS